MTHQLGPESPRPFSVISEVGTRTNLSLPHVPKHELFSFGESYEKRMCQLIHQVHIYSFNFIIAGIKYNQGFF